MDPYAVLGVPRTASEAEIRKAYKNKAAACHPDRGGDAEEFKRVSAAYAILSDAEKKATFDRGGDPQAGPSSSPYGSRGGGGAFEGGGGDLFDAFRLFEEFIRGADHPFGGGGGAGHHRFGGITPRVVALELRLEELFVGVRRRVEYRREVACEACGGAGGRVQACEACGGTGVVVTERRGGGFVQRIQSRCGSCGGAGARLVERCYSCGGAGRVAETATVEVDVPAGAEAGDQFEFPQAGDDVFAGSRHLGRRDLVVVVEELPHSDLQRVGQNLFVARHVSLIDALTGFAVEVPCLETGKPLVAAAAKHGLPVVPDDVWVLRGAGMPGRRDPSRRGDLYVRFVVDFPSRLPRHPQGEAERRRDLAACLGGDPRLSEDAPAESRLPSFRLFKSSSRPAADTSRRRTQTAVRAPQSEVDAFLRRRRHKKT
ncbi:hypothetical protein CTAYLR_003928 [Chrysophaeum taylorii]|uniref:Uncharacterized protein n=1 Tax=Chrysophaeum taylorii TaxID=2483200 RepID=A0AAD7U9L3_9STRA|nr:hypothetical protein CTAYLR_003928 [Chrysophaeum taylorii]